MDNLLIVKDLLLFNNETKAPIIQIDSFVLNKGEQAIIFGNNGSGKSTFLNCFCRSVGHDYCSIKNGSIVLNVEGKSFNLLSLKDRDLEAVDKLIVYVGQEEKYAFGYFDSIIESLSKKSLEIADSSQIEKIIEEATNLAFKHLDEIYIHDKKYNEAKGKEEKRIVAVKILNKKLARNCSSGQKKMISILRAILFARIYKSSLLVLDEPLNHLDYKNKIIVNDEMKALISDNKELSILIITHCLIFDFINSKTCTQYVIERKENNNFISKIPNSKKRSKVNCLEEC